MIRGWGLAGGQGALLTGPGNSIPPHPLALPGICSQAPGIPTLLAWVSTSLTTEDFQSWGHAASGFWPK